MASIAFKTGKENVTIGSNLDYAGFVHEGTPKMRSRPFLRDAINENKRVYEQIAASEMKKGFN